MSEKALFIFTISPVQTYIEQARKTKDLFAGSTILSELCKEAIESINKYNSTIIFPNSNSKSLPNRFLAEINADEETLKSIGDKLKEAVVSKFRTLAGVCPTNSENGLKELFDKQIENHLSINWVVYKYENDYEGAYKVIEKYLRAVKNVKTFKQIEEADRKCSICGERTALFYKSDKDKNGKDKRPYKISPLAYNIKNKNPDCNIKPNDLQNGEAICSVCLMKRLYENKGKQNFLSLAEICCMDVVSKLNKDELKNYKNIFGEENFDEELLYEENLTPEYFKKNGFDKEKEIENIKSKMKDLIDNHKLKKYYALIMLDGDNMGKWLSGGYFQDKSQLYNFHQNISEKLNEYSNNVDCITKYPKGKLVYCGGDDVLAFANLSSLFEILKDLRSEFPDFTNGFNINENKKPSASAGVVIAHYKTPLRNVLQEARNAEKKAKDTDNKDAVAITIMKRSGETVQSVFKCDDIEKTSKDNNKQQPDEKKEDEKSTLSIMGQLVEELKKDNDGLSSTFIINLNKELQKLIDFKNDNEFGNKDEIIENEIKRLVKRSVMVKKEEQETESAYLERKKEYTKKWVDNIKKVYRKTDNDKIGDNFRNYLEIADFLSRKVGE